MNADKKTKATKARPGFIRGDWHKRVHPAYIAWYSVRKKNTALPKIKDEKESMRQFKQHLKEAGLASRAFNEALSQIKDPVGRELGVEIERGTESEGRLTLRPVRKGQEPEIYAENPESSSIFRQLVFLKYGITFRELIWQVDIKHDRVAHRKLMAVHKDYWKLLNGVPYEKLKLKSSSHFGIIGMGLNFGLDDLTSDELADCLDEICPCGQKHSPEYLKKVRTQIKRACKRNY